MVEKIYQLLLCIFLKYACRCSRLHWKLFTKHKASQIGFFPRGEIMHIVKMHWRLLQIFFSKYLLIPAEVDCGFSRHELWRINQKWDVINRSRISKEISAGSEWSIPKWLHDYFCMLWILVRIIKSNILRL